MGPALSRMNTPEHRQGILSARPKADDRGLDDVASALPPTDHAHREKLPPDYDRRRQIDQSPASIFRLGEKVDYIESARAIIIAGAWRRLRSSASRRSSAIGCKLARLMINSKS